MNPQTHMKISQIIGTNNIADLLSSAWGACDESKEWLATQPDIDTAWSACEEPGWMIDGMKKSGRFEKIVYVDIAVQCAQRVLAVYEKQYPDDKRPADAIKAVLEYINNPSASSAASAASDASDAARAAASDAARAAAWAASDAAIAAAWAASAASAAWAASASSAASDAWAAEKKTQCAIIRAVVENRCK